MKDILESSESFTAHATIDAGYFMLNQLNARFPKNGLNKAIDLACGRDVNKEVADLAVPIVKEIIAAKKLIEADYSADAKFLQAIQGG